MSSSTDTSAPTSTNPSTSPSRETSPAREPSPTKEPSPAREPSPEISIMRYSPVPSGNFDWSEEPYEGDQAEETTTIANNNASLSAEPDSSASLPDTNSSSNSSGAAQTFSLPFRPRAIESDDSHGLASEPENIPSSSPITNLEENQSGDHQNEPTSTSDDPDAGSPLSETTEPALEADQPVPEWDFNFDVPWLVGLVREQVYTKWIDSLVDERRGSRRCRQKPARETEAWTERRFSSPLRFESVIEEDRYRVYELQPVQGWSKVRYLKDGTKQRKSKHTRSRYYTPGYEEPVEWTESRRPRSPLYRTDEHLDNTNLTPEEIEKRDLIILSERVYYADERREEDLKRRFGRDY